MTRPEPGDIFLVPFPFTDLKTSKQRPALVLEAILSRSLPTLVIVAMMTSQVEAEKIPGDCVVKYWKEAGLLHPSKVRLAKLVSLEDELLLKPLGKLAKEDRQAVGREFLKLFSDWT